MYCTKCGAELLPNANFCTKCGARTGNFYLKQIVDNWDVLNSSRYDMFDNIIYQTSNSNNPLDILACAYAHHFSKSDHRKQAIIYFERFFSFENIDDFFPIIANPYYSKQQIHCDLAKDYEGEYNFKQAERHYILSISYSQRYYDKTFNEYSAIPAEIMLGRLYLKIGTQEALDYWEKLKGYDEYINGNPDHCGFRRAIDVEYKKALDKHNKGYVYKPKNKTK